MSMNIVVLEGRVVADPEVRKSGSGNFTTFTLAVNRSYKNKQTGQYDADFIRCIANGASAEFISNHFKKGDPMEVTGSIRVSNYKDKDGNTRSSTDVSVSNVSFVTQLPKGDTQQKPQASAKQKQSDGEWMNVQDAIRDDDLPFA